VASLGVTTGLLLDTAGVDAGTHRVPESTPTISASDSSRRVRCPADGSSSSICPGGHTERYSPPGPNLHSGSIRLIRYISILGTLNSIRFSTWFQSTPVLSATPFRKPKQKPNKFRPTTNLFAHAHPPELPPTFIWDG
jgi:hypothetical protein